MTKSVLAAVLLVAALLLLAAAYPAVGAESIDYDTDDDGLIEIHNLAQLNNIRWDRDGDGQIGPHLDKLQHAIWHDSAGTATYAESFPKAAEGMGCPAKRCRGYELEADLDFDSNGDGQVTAEDHGGAYWGDGFGWPHGFTIGAPGSPYSAEFNGNGHTISHLFVDQTGGTAHQHLGLFGVVTGTIRNLGVINADIGATHATAGIIASSLQGSGSIRNSYATGKIRQLPTDEYTIAAGGLAGRMWENSEIAASYSTASISGNSTGSSQGGLVGYMHQGRITASYATGPVTGWARVGALAGTVALPPSGSLSSHGYPVITASYATGAVNYGGPLRPAPHTFTYHLAKGLVGRFDSPAHRLNNLKNSYSGSVIDPPAGRESTPGSDVLRVYSGPGLYSVAELQEPTGYTGLYAKWNRDLDGDGNPDDPWDFGASSQYPVLKVDFNGDGKATWEEFGSQRASQSATPNSQSPEEQAAAAHPEVYKEAEYGLKVTCSEVQKFHAKLTFDLGGYTGKLALSLSLWGSSSYLSYESHGLNTPALKRDGQTAYVEISTHPPKTRFRLDTPDGRNLLLGYADCRTDAPALDEDGNPLPPPPKTPEERAAEDNKEVYETGNGDDGDADDAPMSVSCEVGGDSATLTFNLGGHSGPVQLTLMQWDGVVFRSYAALGLTAPALQRNGQTATVEIPTHTPERVRFRLDSEYGRNLLLGYADCHEDEPGPVTEVTEETPEETVTPVTPGGPPVVQSAAATLPPAATAANREVYADAGRAMLVSCTEVTAKGATLNFDLGSYTRSLTMVLSLWDGTVFRSYASQNIPQPALERDGQKATVSIATNPALTRFRLDSDIGTNLLLGYADCRTDAP